MTATPAGATCKHSRCTRMQPSSGDVARNAGPVDSSSISYIFQPGGARNGPASCSSGPPAHALMRAPHKYRMLECLEASRASTQAEARPGQREPNASRPARPERPGEAGCVILAAGQQHQCAVRGVCLGHHGIPISLWVCRLSRHCGCARQ